jgi:hypothetical protein
VCGKILKKELIGALICDLYALILILFVPASFSAMKNIGYFLAGRDLQEVMLDPSWVKQFIQLRSSTRFSEKDFAPLAQRGGYRYNYIFCWIKSALTYILINIKCMPYVLNSLFVT